MEVVLLPIPEEQRTTKPAVITEEYLSGYHRFCLEKPYHLDYISQSLCDMLGYSAHEIHTLFDDHYSQMVYVKDRPRFLHFIDNLAGREQTLNLQYRMICKDGHMAYINDTITSRRMNDGLLYGFSVAADVTEHLQETSIFPDPDKLIGPYGFIQCTCEKYPKITHINNQMLDYLGLTHDSSSWNDFLKDNVFFMLPFEERDRFREYLEQVERSSEPVTIVHQVLRNDGTRLPLRGLLSLNENAYGEKNYSILYTHSDVPDMDPQSLQDNSYFHVLESAYHAIFEINLKKNTVECIHGKDTTKLGSLCDIRMTMESARNFWLNNYILEDDRPVMKDFLEQICNPSGDWGNTSVLQAEFRVKWVDRTIYRFLGVAVQADSSTVLFCLRDISQVHYSPVKTKERIVLDKMSEWMEAFVPQAHSALGVIFIEGTNDKRSITYASPRVYQYLGMSREEYLRYIAQELPWTKAFESVGFTVNDFEYLLRTGSLHIALPDPRTGMLRDFSLVSTPFHSPRQESVFYEVLVYDSVTEVKRVEENRSPDPRNTRNLLRKNTIKWSGAANRTGQNKIMDKMAERAKSDRRLSDKGNMINTPDEDDLVSSVHDRGNSSSRLPDGDDPVSLPDESNTISTPDGGNPISPSDKGNPISPSDKGNPISYVPDESENPEFPANSEAAIRNSDARIFVRTFGHFDLFLDGRPINFSSAKEKELMALLIDRRGGTLTSGEAISYLWENEEVNDRVARRYRKLAMGLKNTLTKYGIENILINNHGIRSIDVSAIVCDYYELLKGNSDYQNSFHNLYMSDYSWAEETLATLWDYS
jgi:PAS domain S-box-containing protein